MTVLDLKNKIWLYASMMFVGALLAVTLSTIGFYSYKVKKLNSNNIVPKTGTITQNADTSAALAEKDRIIKELQDKNSNLELQINNFKASGKANANDYINLMKADDLIKAGNYSAGMDILNSLNENSFIDYAKDKYLSLKSQASNRAGYNYYNQGIAAGKKRDYKTAAALLSKAVEYGAGQAYADDAAYNAAVQYKASGDIDSARKYLDILLRDYPKSPYISKAKLLYAQLAK